MARPSSLVRAVARTALVGALVAVAVWSAGTLLGRVRLGPTDEAATRRVENELGRQFHDVADALTARVVQAKSDPAAISQASRDTAAARSLFTRLAALLPPDVIGRAGLTIYSAGATPLAWAGRVSDIPRDRLDGPASLFVALDALGPRLIRVDPIIDGSRPNAPPLAIVVAEQLVEPRSDAATSANDTFRLPTSVVDVSLRATPGLAPPRAPYGFAIRAADGRWLADAELSPGDLAAARERWAMLTRTAAMVVLALAILLASAPILEARRHGRTASFVLGATVALVGVLVAARWLLYLAFLPLQSPGSGGPTTLLPTALLLAALVWLALDSMERRRVARPRVTLLADTASSWFLTGGAYAVAGAAAAMLLWLYERTLAGMALLEAQDLVHFSLHPFELTRVGLLAALTVLHAAVVWGAAGVIRLPSTLWRSPRSGLVINGVAAVAGTMVSVWVLSQVGASIPGGPLALACAVALLSAWALSRPRGPVRRASQAARLGLLFLALVVPALALYPSLQAFAVAFKEQNVMVEMAPLVASQREDLQLRRLPQALESIDALTTLAEFVTTSDEDAAPTTDRAFIIWSQTELARSRTTSAVELYGASGRLVSRFALDLPEYAPTEYRGGSCSDWELFEEVSPFGSALRNVLRASRALCARGRRVGGIVVRAQLDYRALPFVSRPNPYLESLLPGETVDAETSTDLELAVYGWSRAPIYTSGARVWPLDDDIFRQMSMSRAASWKAVERDGQSFRVYFFNDRGGIYALGYPQVTGFGHVINLAELVFFCGVLYGAMLAGATLFNLLTSQTPAGGRALLRELRSSFYRKLFIAFVGAAVTPVVVLAVAASTYFATQFRNGVEESAVKTATVAQRLIEDYVALQQRGAGSIARIDDEFMLLVRRAIDEDVNLFDGARLRATSERPLFASRLLPGRTPADVYRAIALDRLPTTVVVEELGRSAGYLVAAAPVRAGASEGIVTVPQTLRQREIEQQIDELDRRVLSAAVMFVVLGAALGYWMAERIADPVNRLTRATRRIARGDLDARIAATSSDELRRLVEDFNRMADDLKRQRANLERTQRLEAWAEMARQVAHDIKNPLTPIQLSAEHAQRVNIDRGRPLSPALDECVSSILSQVRLLRQISSEFSSFASSPTARPEPTNLGDLLTAVAEPYRTGLAGRVTLTVDAEPGLPLAFIDPALYTRALTNVIENALQAMPGGGSLTMRASRLNPGADAAAEPAAISVEVTDTGLGMDADALARIFEPYFSTKATGTGLGLVIARRNVELLGGTIAVRSEKGVGTTVSMTLPVAV